MSEEQAVQPIAKQDNQHINTKTNEAAQNNLSITYDLHKTHELHCETASTFISKSTDEMTSSEIDAPPSSFATNPNTPPRTYNYTMVESTDNATQSNKNVHNYFTGLQEANDASCNSLSDYPTDEQTLNTLNSLNSHYRSMFGMDDAPSYGRSLTGDTAASLEDVQPGFTRDEAAASGVSLERYHRQAAVNQANINDVEQKSINSSNDSMENNVQQKKARPNRFHILEMAKRRMGLASARKSPSSSADEIDRASALKADNVMNTVPSLDAEKSNNASDSDSFLGDAIVENVNSTTPSNQYEKMHSPIADESSPSYNIHASNLSQSTMTTSTNRGFKNAFLNVGGDTFAYSCPNVWKKADKDEEGSFLGDAVVKDVTSLPSPSTQQQSVDNSDESLPSYNIHASTLSQSTMTTSTNRGAQNAFVNMGGDTSIYASPKTIVDDVPESFETPASPSTVIASGSRPIIVDSATESSASTTASGHVMSAIGISLSESSTSDSMPSTSARELHKSTLSAADRPLDSRASLTSTVDDMILHESNLAVKNLGNNAKRDASPHRDMIQVAAITPVRRNGTDSQPSSIESYSYNAAYQNSDNITSNPEQSLPATTSTENPFSPNLPEDYSFCPSSKHSTFSTLTDEYRNYYDVTRRTGGAAAVIKEKKNIAEQSRTISGPVDVDTNEIIAPSPSLTRPPAASFHSDSQSWVFSYGNAQHLSSIIQYPSADAGDGDSGAYGEGYVDEEAAIRYASLHQSRRGCMPKVLIWAAVVLLAVSLATVTFGVILRKDEDTQSNTLLNRPAPTNEDEGGKSQNSGLIPAVPELAFQRPTSAPADAPTLPKPVTPIAEIFSEMITNQPSMKPIELSQSPSYSPKLPIQEVIETYAPSMRPSKMPSKLPTSLPTPNPSPPPSKQTPSSAASNLISSEDKSYTTTIKVSRDTYIRSTASIWNYGSSDFLSVDQDPRSITVMAFDINLKNQYTQQSRRHYDATNEDQSHRKAQTAQEEIATHVKAAKLRLYALEDSETGGEVYGLTNAKKWNESELTWDNARNEVSASGEVYVASIDEAVQEYLWYEIDVTSAFDCCVDTVGTTSLNLMIQTDSTDGVTYASKEYESGLYAPELILTYSVEMVV